MSEPDDALTRLVRRLAEIDETLRALPRDAFEQRYRLKSEQDELRLRAAGWGAEVLARRSDENLLAEADSIRSAIDRLLDSRIDMVMQMQARVVPVPSEIRLNDRILQAGGIDELRARLAQLTTELDLRGLTPG
ncbi:MAG: hypothetical protein GY929_22415 [Actinomycetia bacterium]|nr:hypothetical protein [Actinomycetes bacterium]